MDHDNLGVEFLLAIRNEHTAVVFGGIELLIKPESSLVPFAHLTIVINNRRPVSSRCRFMNEGEAAFLDHCSGALAITHKLNNE